MKCCRLCTPTRTFAIAFCILSFAQYSNEVQVCHVVSVSNGCIMDMQSMWFVADIEIKREPADPPPTPPPRVIGVLLPIKKEETDTDSDNPHDEEPQPHHEAAGKQ